MVCYYVEIRGFLIQKKYLEQALLDKSLVHVQSICLQPQVFLKQSTNPLKCQRTAFKDAMADVYSLDILMHRQSQNSSVLMQRKEIKGYCNKS